MEFLTTHVGTILAVASAVVGVLGWFLRLEYRVKAMESKCDIFDLHVTDTGRHANGKSLDKLEHKLDELREEMIDSRREEREAASSRWEALEAKIDKLFDRLYDQKR